MFNNTLRQQLTSAREQQFEIDLVLDGRTVFPSLVVTSLTEDCATLVDAEGSLVSMNTDDISGVIIHPAVPKWFSGVARHIELDAREHTHTNRQEQQKVGATS